ncbi:type I-F CRISPR-associated endoribonuclease Cas6/Csy4 [Xanthomonas nasturtii]|uniref:Type I-F CRISPR-associated endoribonuclease Cas6/Csy4 n=1 Tax=Xanthomonas nasturtii TaxID=1843581 RepID=A0A3E1KQJ3_9XANT|nr:type I-F CRISPR-associated endoribonuclease Cas6/Csy4 [Xanthomonas nasturtii]MCL1528910.1 type I-F CRISPR-associated endoribonuclease Cas6/Csy4 [Xanthomonas nasturtii]MCL1564046.1 type I-F CRISPR-associated endoribonuclease Cas6/Csy4 [Xanthomonas nasturtii]MCL1568057.1 type I-F CRISPR-associated endoribonuclease Cas6/Csy4 [Xanthomonas nasturtii]MCL1571883.1 type I-F CRISPR-associated endoribonuclease Cas6/Csy4 [Xanthomonas nasturtii]MCL1579304.1 type I-F CRISPR-associated endoribonuclease C
MDHYVDLQLRPDPELAPHQLLSSLYARLHRALVQQQRQDIGVSFPCHDTRKPHLGTNLRLHGRHTALQALMASAWLQGIHDHLTVSPIVRAPAGSQHRQVTRVQAKSSPSRLRRRAMRRHGIDAVTAAQCIPDAVAEQLSLPFVVLGSCSTGQASFPLFIRHGPLLSEPKNGSFNSYGLSQEATVPWF